MARFRGNLFNQRGAVAAVFRTIPWEIRSFDALGLPQVARKLCDKPRGLILVTGPTGSGKSTTLAAMLDKINSEREEHMITIEDPIEFLHNHKKCLVNQREIHSDTHSFANSLRAALRQDPDVVLIGEMRDLETIESALRIAETGHLTFATLHTNSAISTINRVSWTFFPRTSSRRFARSFRWCSKAFFAKRCCLERMDAGGSWLMEVSGPDGRHPQPDPRRQDSPDLFGHANRPGQIRNADVQSGAGDALFPEEDYSGNCACALVESGRVAGYDQSGRWTDADSRNSAPLSPIKE